MSHNGRILITGASGFIGGRLVERLAREGKRLRLVTSDFRRCARVARFPVELVKADILDPQALARTVEGCDVIFHLAYRFGGAGAEQRRVNLEGTRALAEAALAQGVRRFVHCSSVAAYGPPANGDLTEATEPRHSSDPYSDTKQRIDDMLRRLHTRRGLPLTILQPTIVYGPYGGTWTTPLLAEVATSRVVLPASDSGLCNAVYVDDVVSAAVLASESESAVGESFLISAAAPVTWRAFFGAYERMAGTESLVLMDDAQLRVESRRRSAGVGWIRMLRNALAKRPELRERVLAQAPQRWIIRGGQLALPRPVQAAVRDWYGGLWQIPLRDARPLLVPDPASLALYTARAHVRIEKARNRLGFTPAYDLEQGMSKTAAWARWANLLPHEQR
jgi:nucleoside-diphosphate-sugar epimerase